MPRFSGSGLQQLTLTTSEARSLQLANLDVFEPAIVLVIREHDVPLDVLAEVFVLWKFALREAGLHFRTVELEREDILAVEPVLDVVSARDDARLIPFTRRPQGFV